MFHYFSNFLKKKRLKNETTNDEFLTNVSFAMLNYIKMDKGFSPTKGICIFLNRYKIF